VEPDHLVLLSQHQGIAEAPASTVRDLLLAVPTGQMPGSRAPLVLGLVAPSTPVLVDGGPRAYRAQVAGIEQTIEVDRDAGWVQVRGQLWRCVRFAARHHPQGTLVIQRTYSYAAGRDGEFLTTTLGRWHDNTGRQALTALLDVLAARLGCQVRILST
jgi:hypothetical protein